MLLPNIIKTKDYNEAIKKLKISNEEIFDKTINSFVKMEEQSNYNVVKAPSFCKEYQNHKIQLWKIRLPNPFANKGKSCGFRLLLVLKYENKSWFLHKIFAKTDNSEKNIQKEIKTLEKEYNV